MNIRLCARLPRRRRTTERPLLTRELDPGCPRSRRPGDAHDRRTWRARPSRFRSFRGPPPCGPSFGANEDQSGSSRAVDEEAPPGHRRCAPSALAGLPGRRASRLRGEPEANRGLRPEKGAFTPFDSRLAGPAPSVVEAFLPRRAARALLAHRGLDHRSECTATRWGGAPAKLLRAAAIVQAFRWRD